MELGATVEFHVGQKASVFVGGGYNFNLGAGDGYTVRGGIYRFRKRNHFISFQVFWRQWTLDSLWDYGGNIGILNEIVNPDYSNPSDLHPIYNVDNVKVWVACADLIFGNRRYLSRRKKSGMLEFFYGLGVRYKSIRYENLGYVNSGWHPNNPPIITTQPPWGIDVQVGILLGGFLRPGN